jgi:thioesterase domain-containing protein/acyl carrier protein/NAD(P)-dependent dehydrogenase (short-subunit alcohol dehydrogenase family)
VDWLKLYPDGAGRRLNLPTYPFQGKRYWVAAAERPERKGQGFWDNVEPGLLDSRVSARLDAADPLLNDHRVRGQAWLPAAGYLSLTVNAAATLIPQRALTGLRDVILASPFTIAGDASRELQVRFTVADGLVRVTIASLDGVVERQHIQGQLNFTPAPTWPTLDIAALQAVCPEVVAHEAIHQRFAALGIEYGSTYRLLQRVWVGDGQVLGELATPEADPRFTALPPGLLDSALQTLIGFALTESTDSDRLMLPFAIDAVQFVGPLTNVRYVHARRRPITGDTLGFDLSLSDDAGRVSLCLENFRVRTVKDSSFTLACLAMRWETTPWPEPVPPFAGDVLILRAEQDFGLSAVLRSAFPRNTVHEVWLADRWQRDRHDWRIDARSVADFSRLLQDITDCARIYFLGSLQDETELDLAVLEISKERGLLPLFRLGQALAAQPLTVAHPHLVVVTHDSEAVGDEAPHLPYSAACRGLAKVIGRENPGLAVTCLDLSRADLLEVRTDMGQRLAAESGALPFATVAWRGDQRYQPHLLRQSLPTPAASPFRVGGTYLIVGGAGGLGLTVARYLTQHYQARVALVGRCPLDPEIQARLDELRAMGGEALYLQGDVADLGAMQAVCREARDRWGHLHGVIHAAAVLSDGLLARLSEADFTAVLRPKLAGTVALALALSKGESLDWLALFSSTASLTANPGQGNYTAASVGQDAIGLMLPALLNIPVRVINWGYWGEVGVAANATVQRLAATQGIGAIDAEEGLAVLERILAGEARQVAVLKATPSVLGQMGVEESVASGTTPALRATPPYPEKGMHTPKPLEQLVRAALREVLKLDEEDLDDYTLFEQYGVDSLIAIGVLQCLERQTGPLPKTLLFEYRTIAELVAWLEQRATPRSEVVPQIAETPEPSSAASILAIRATGSQPASFWVHSVVGEIAWVARLAEALGEGWPVYGFPARALSEQGSHFATLEAMASAYLGAVRHIQPHGPYLLGGYSFGGAVAFEMARQLLDEGEKIQGLLLLDAYAPGGEAMRALRDLSSDAFMVQAVANLLILQWQGSALLKPEDLTGDRVAQVSAAAGHLRAVCPAIPQQSGELEVLLHRQLELMQRHAELLEAYQPQPCLDPELPVLLVRSTRGFVGADNDLALQPVQRAAGEEEDYGWSRWLARPPHLVRVAADHFSLGLEPAIGEAARYITAWLTQAGAVCDSTLSGEENARMEQVFQVVKRHVLDILPHLPPEAITLDASLRELGANSLDRAEVAVCSMETLGINVPRKELAAVTNLRELVAVLCAYDVSPYLYQENTPAALV